MVEKKTLQQSNSTIFKRPSKLKEGFFIDDQGNSEEKRVHNLINSATRKQYFNEGGKARPTETTTAQKIEFKPQAKTTRSKQNSITVESFEDGPK